MNDQSVQPKLTTERLVLEPWHDRWREEWVSLAADPRVTRWIGSGEPWDRNRSESEFDWMLDHWRHAGGSRTKRSPSRTSSPAAARPTSYPER